MLRRRDQFFIEQQPHLKGGQGCVELHHILTKQEMLGSGRLFAISILPPGSTIGYHQHSGEFEVYYILKGKGQLILNGNVIELNPGDMTCCGDGDSHGLENVGEGNLEYIAVILIIPECAAN
ncbi:MAG: cupin domain-containing protein [Bacillota bacterium]